jgi:hypothetical protein
MKIIIVQLLLLLMASSQDKEKLFTLASKEILKMKLK